MTNSIFNRDEILSSPEYWITKIQTELYSQLENYMIENKLNKTQLAEKIGVTKGYISQILNGDFDHKLSKLVELSLAIERVPLIDFRQINQYVSDESLGLTNLSTDEATDEIRKLIINSSNQGSLYYNQNSNAKEESLY